MKTFTVAGIPLMEEGFNETPPETAPSGVR
jgi:hypothetical protein